MCAVINCLCGSSVILQRFSGYKRTTRDTGTNAAMKRAGICWIGNEKSGAQGEAEE